MEIRVLKYFLMVAREENITRAASLLHLTQPTLSRQLKQLEDELGVRLFERSRHRIILTEEGMLLRRRAQEIVSLEERAKQDVRKASNELEGSVTVGSGELKSSDALMKLITDFQRGNPLVRFNIYSGNSDDIKERIDSGLVDVGLLQEPVEISKYEFVRTGIKERWGAIVCENSELALKSCVTPDDLVGKRLIVPARETIKNELYNWLSGRAGELTVIAQGNLLYNLAVLAKNSQSSILTLELDCKYSGLCFLPLKPAIESETVLVWKKAQAFSKPVAAFIAAAKKYFSGMK